MIKCSKCEIESDFNYPYELCKLHWAEWWISKIDFSSEEERLAELNFVLNELKD